MNLYRFLLDKNSNQVLECSKIPNDHKDGVEPFLDEFFKAEFDLSISYYDYIKSRGIFYYNFDNVIINMDYDFDNPSDGSISNPLQEKINRNIYNNALIFIRNLKLEDLDI